MKWLLIILLQLQLCVVPAFAEIYKPPLRQRITEHIVDTHERCVFALASGINRFNRFWPSRIDAFLIWLENKQEKRRLEKATRQGRQAEYMTNFNERTLRQALLTEKILGKFERGRPSQKTGSIEVDDVPEAFNLRFGARLYQSQDRGIKYFPPDSLVVLDPRTRLVTRHVVNRD